MGSVYGPNIVTDNLAVYFDAGNVQSYPGSGTTWYDIVGSNNGTLVNGPAYNSGDGGYFILDSTNDYIAMINGNIVIKSAGGWTIESWVYATSIGNGTWGPRNLTGHDDAGTVGWYWSMYNSKLAIWNKSPGVWKYGSTTLTAGVWMHCVCVSENVSGTSYQFYLNGVAEGGDHASYTFSGAGVYKYLEFQYIGKGNDANPRLWYGRYSAMRMYTEPLSAAEVLQNYNAHKSRFGL